MVECNDVSGRVVRSIRLYEEGPYGPEISIGFEDGTSLTVTLQAQIRMDAVLTRDGEGGPVPIWRSRTPSSS